MKHVQSVRQYFLNNFDPTLPMNEIIGASFLANEDYIFMRPNKDYISREIAWYLSQSLSVDDIPGGPPEIWSNISSENREINSNYGYLFLSSENGAQMKNVVDQLLHESDTGRRAVAVYTRPSIHADYYRDGMQDFICTNAVNYYRRDGKIHAVVQMRSNDVVYGYRNDYAWQRHALEMVVNSMNERLSAVGSSNRMSVGDITWQAGSLHIYPRHYRYVMKEILKSLFQKHSPYRCSRKKVVAFANCKCDHQHHSFNGGLQPCLRETPGREPSPDYSDCPYEHAEPKLMKDVALCQCGPVGVYVTSPPCLGCCESLKNAGVKFVVYGYRESVDGHLPMEEISEALKGVPTWMIPLDES
jgi:thymidylate synthase